VERDLSTRLIVRVGVPAALLFLLVIVIAAQRSFRYVVDQTERSSRALARHAAARLEVDLSRATKIPEMIATHLGTGTVATEKGLETSLRGLVAGNREIYGSCIAFEPFSFNPQKKYYAPYYYWKDGAPEFVQLGNPEYDYFKWEWYRAPKAAGKARWSEPYFDEGGGNTIMTTYSVPFWRGKEFWGIATIDIAIAQLVKRMETLAVGKTGYAFVVSRQGRFLAYPDESKIMRGKIQEVNAELGRRMVAGEDGFLRTTEPVGGRDAWVTFVPVQSGEFSLAMAFPQSELVAEALGLQLELLVLGIIGLSMMFLTIVFIARSVTRPIANLAHAAQLVAAGELDQKLDTNTPINEVRDLTRAFNKMTRDLRMRMEELRYTVTIKERLEGELSGARSIQMSLLPKEFPAFPERQEIDIHAMLRPAREVGGDFYDFFFVDEQRLCVLVADVSGKGIPAALFMAVTKTLLKAHSSPLRSASEIVARVNEEVCDEGDTGMFVTLLYAQLDTRTGQLEICNAGHIDPFLVSAEGDINPLGSTAGVALGLMRGLTYSATSRSLLPGEMLFFFTDGVTEALNSQRAFFGAGRLKAVLENAHSEPVESINRRVMQEVREFCDTREQSDDISVLAVRWLGPVVHSEWSETLAGQSDATKHPESQA